MVSVVIPTRSRPDYVRNALESVKGQSVAHLISDVIVSENGGCKKSEEVCLEFPELPIRHVLRAPQLSLLEHHEELFCSEPNQSYVAMLHDDDWWQRDHLEKNLDALEKDPTLAASFSGFLCVNSDDYGLQTSYGHHAVCFGAGSPPFSPELRLRFQDWAVASFMIAPIHFSGLLARKDILKRAMRQVAATQNPFDIDRMLPLAISMEGDIAYHGLPNVCVRMHTHQDQRTFYEEERLGHMLRTTEWIIEQCRIRQVDLGFEVLQRLRDCAESIRCCRHADLSAPWCLPAGKTFMAHHPEMRGVAPMAWWATPRCSGTKRLVEPFIPPVVFSAIERFRSWL